MTEAEIGIVRHFFDKIGVAAIATRNDAPYASESVPIHLPWRWASKLAAMIAALRAAGFRGLVLCCVPVVTSAGAAEVVASFAADRLPPGYPFLTFFPAVVLSTFLGGGHVHMLEIGEALDRFRATGKPILAYAIAYSDDSVMLAAHANEVWVDPMGGAAVTGPGGGVPAVALNSGSSTGLPRRLIGYWR